MKLKTTKNKTLKKTQKTVFETSKNKRGKIINKTKTNKNITTTMNKKKIQKHNKHKQRK